MAKTLLITLGAIVLIGAAGAGTYFILDALKADETANDTTTVDSSTKDTKTEDTDSEKLDTARNDNIVKNSLSKVSSAIVKYMSNNRGVLPTTETVLTPYLADVDLKNPATEVDYTVSFTEKSASTIYIQVGFTCSADGTSVQAGTSRQFAVSATLPSGVQHCSGM